MIRNIVFDMGGVLMDFKPDLAIRPYVTDGTDAALLKSVIFDSEEWQLLDRGTITDEDALSAWYSRLPERLHATCRLVYENWHIHMPFFPETAAFADTLRAEGYRVYLLSNASKRFHVYRDLHPVLARMDGILLSCDCRLLKPEPAIYRLLTDTFALRAEECFFVDDSEKNTSAAAAAGFTTFRYTGDAAALKRAMLASEIIFTEGNFDVRQ